MDENVANKGDAISAIKYFVDIVGTDNMGRKLECTAFATKIDMNGNVVVVFEEDFVEIRCNKWKLTTCGYFVGYNMPIA